MSDPSLALGCLDLRLPRRGHTLEECEDACACAPERGRFAIADGAAESSFAAQWARVLVEDFVQASDREPAWASWLPPLQQRWADLIGEQPFPAVMPWYLEARWRQGAFATFLGVVIEDQGWHALAVGDSCLFQVREDALLAAFPMTRAEDFGNTPWLIGSRSNGADSPRLQSLHQQGDWRPGDRLWLTTDALGQWFLRQSEAGEKPWQVFERLRTEPVPEEAFALWVEEQRHARGLRNDDVTLVAVWL
jgi:hypothetical protein